MKGQDFFKWQEEQRRMLYSLIKLEEMKVEVVRSDSKKIEFIHKGQVCILWPYSGWHTGKTIKDGRGLKNLLNQLK